MNAAARRTPHPVVWAILYVPFGAMSGFVTVALTFLATKRGLSISEGALLYGAQMISQWLKWVWAPIFDVTLTPRRWYVISTAASAVGVLGMAAVPLSPETLGWLLAVIAIASIINSGVGMSAEAIIASCTPPEEVGRVSAWFQAGNLGGTGLGGALGLYLVIHLPHPWMAGAIMGALFLVCCFALLATPPVESRHRGAGAIASIKSVVHDLRLMLKTKGGLLSAILCILPLGTGAAQIVLTQAKVAATWGAGEREVQLLQGLMSGFVTMAGCFAGGWICQRFHPRSAYVGVGLAFAVITLLMAVSPQTVTTYVVWCLIYSFAVGLSYAAFTAYVLLAMGHGSGATKYNVFASLSNFPIWWLALLLGVVADQWSPRAMLVTESLLGLVAALVFAASVGRVRRSGLPLGVAS